MADNIFSEKYITVFRHNPCSVIRQYVVLFFLCVIAFMFIWGIKYAGSTNVFFLMMSPAGLSDVSGCDV